MDTMTSQSRARLSDALYVVLAAFTLLSLTSCGGGDEPVGPVEPEPDVPTSLVIHAGDGQTAVTGIAVRNPVQVRVTGRTGAALAGVSVSFAVTAGGGSIEASTAVTGADGVASPGPWTLGPPGPQQMRADVTGLAPVGFNATATAAPAEIAIVTGTDQEAGVASAVAVPPEVLVTDADGAPLNGVPVTFVTERDAVLTGAEANTDGGGRASVGSWTLGTATGTYWLEARLTGSGIKGNPARFEALALPGPASDVAAIEGDGQEAETTLPVPIRPRVRVQDAHGNAVPGATVSFEASGGSVAIPTQTVSDSSGFAAVDKWVLGTTAGASYRLTASVKDGNDNVVGSATFTATATPAVYNIEIIHVNPSMVSDSLRAAFDKAEQFWEGAIKGNLPWSTVRQHALEECLSKNGFDYEVPGDRVVDDLLIYVEIRNTGGGVLGGAGPCQIRADTGLPVVGIMFFDRNILYDTIIHEMAHVIGFGSLWEYLGLLKDKATGAPGTDPHFVGLNGIQAFLDIGGADYTMSKPVPVENLGGKGVWNGHWRESVFRTELMTSFVNGGVPNPLSVLTLASFQDLGYEQVDLSLADEFVLPPQAVAPDIAEVGIAEPGQRIELRDDILRTPIAVVDQDGTVIRYIVPAR